MFGQVQDVDLKRLRVFVTIARAGGFSAAQAELNTSQGYISTQMKSLEERLGTRLCQRGHAGFRLTESGRAVLQAAEKLFEALDTFRQESVEAVDPMVGTVRIGVIDQMATNEKCAIAKAIADFANVAPNASISLIIAPPMDLETALLDGQIELAYGIFHHQLPSLSYETIGREQHELYCSHAHPLFDKPDAEITVESLNEFEYVGWDYLESGELAESPLSGELRAASPYMEAVLHYILSGRYIGYLPSHVAQSWVAQGRLKSLCSKVLLRKVDVRLVTSKGAELPDLAKSFKTILFDSHQVS